MLRYLLPFPVRHHAADFWALRDVSFELGPGKVLGVIGRNGSGKSTLMQMVAGLLQPSEGSISVEGNIAALLELGAGFNPDFTGRENIILSGTIYGYSRKDIEARLDQIIGFADIGSHIDAPVKTYSSGMFARLAFAVAIEVNPTLLLVDEILSVGDVGFQARCYRRIEQMKKAGTSILFVSHDLSAVQMLCDEAILLDGGRMVAKGPPKQVTDQYLAMISQRKPEMSGEGPQRDTGPKVTIQRMELTDAEGRAVVHPRVGERYRMVAEILSHVAMDQPVVSLQLKTMMGFVVYDYSTLNANLPLRAVQAGDVLRVTAWLELNICPGPFRLGVGIANIEKDLPVSMGGSERIAFEAISDVRAYGIANLNADLQVEFVPGGVEG
ncbi:MAG TPA: ABC transporter ATP-binding protein [Kiritimatiellia bacterium]|nr:ABC transporter ATP-binding protein [Kiritimatiellia bacterium]